MLAKDVSRSVNALGKPTNTIHVKGVRMQLSECPLVENRSRQAQMTR